MMHVSLEACRTAYGRIPSRILRWLRVRTSGSGVRRRSMHESLFSKFLSASFSASPRLRVENCLPVRVEDCLPV